MKTRINGILFDLGETLIHFGKVNIPRLFRQGCRLAHDYLRRADQPVPPLWLYHLRLLLAVRWNHLKSRLARREFSALELIRRTSKRMGQHLTDEQMVELAWCWYEPLARRGTVRPGTPALLSRLRDGGMTLGVISNTFIPAQVLDRHLAQEGLLELLPVRTYSCQVRRRKPHPLIFAQALRRAGLSPAEVLFVGDSPRADVAGANRAGMVSVLLDPDGRYDRARLAARHRARELAELEEIIRQYNGPAEPPAANAAGRAPIG